MSDKYESIEIDYKLSIVVMLPGYKIIDCLHAGTNVDVYRAIDSSQNRQVVIKLPNSAYPQLELLLQLRHEFAIGQQLHHPHFLETYSLEPYRDGYALVMEDNGGISLAQWLTHSRPSVAVKLQIAIDLALRLHELSQHRIVHRDLNPANITIDPDLQQVKIIDFGIASILPKETLELASPSVLAGTLPYIAPEQTGRMNRGIDYRCDLYSLGITLYELFTGKLPFNAQEPIDWVDCHLHQIAPTAATIAPEVPILISQIIAKLMAKHAEDRYQTALGLKFDLARCQQELAATGNISDFALGDRDRSDRFIIPDRLYGRKTAVKTLLDAFTRVASGSSEFILLSGESGSGKTAVINEVHRPITQQRGYFIKGKFDQFNRDLPLSAFVLAFRDLIGQIATESEKRSSAWKQQILKAIGDRGRVLIEVIPELEGIIGAQPEVAELTGTAAKERFNALFQKFIEVFATKEHPLTIFLDDLHWADADSLELIKVLMAGRGYLLLLGAYRDNEVSPNHPLCLTLNSLTGSGKKLETIALLPLTIDDTTHLVADTLHCSIDRARPLAVIIACQTHGNPFFTSQLLISLHREGLIWFVPTESILDPGGWACDLPAIEALSIANNAVEFMMVQLQKLPVPTQNLLQLAACIGNHFDLQTLVIVAERSAEDIAADLWAALQIRLIVPARQIYQFFHALDRSLPLPIQASATYEYRFLHDRVQQAAYELIPSEQRARIHLQIGRLLLANTPVERTSTQLFEIVEHLNLAKSEIESADEISLLAKLNLDAARKARVAVAYSAAFNYAQTGVYLLGESGWQQRYQLTLELHEALAEAAFLKGDFATVPNLVRQIIDRARTPLDRVKAYEIIIDVRTINKQYQAAIESGLELLSQLGLKLSYPPSKASISKEFIATKIVLIGKSNQQLLSLPPAVDREKIALLKILQLLQVPAFYCCQELMAVLSFIGIRQTLRYGNTPWAATFYATYCIVISGLGEFERSYQLGQLALALLDRFPNLSITARAQLNIAWFCLPWRQPIRSIIPKIEESMKAAIDCGDLQYIGINLTTALIAKFFSGTHLDRLVESISENTALLDLSKDENSRQVADVMKQLINNFHDPAVECPTEIIKDRNLEASLVAQWQASNEAMLLSTLYGFKLLLAYYFDDIPKALIAADNRLPYEYSIQGGYSLATDLMFHALIRLAAYAESNKKIQKKLLARIDRIQVQLLKCAKLRPDNCQHKSDLVAAERCRVFGKYTQAIEYYDRAIAGAKTQEYIQEEALANELAAKFYLGWGKDKIAATYMQSAYYCYVKWGANAKTADLERRYPELLAPILQVKSPPTAVDIVSTLSTLVNYRLNTRVSEPDRPETFDPIAAIQTAQSLSSITELPELLDRLCQIPIEHLGAQICLPILLEREPTIAGKTWQVYTLDPDSGSHTRVPLANYSQLPSRLLARSIESRQIVSLDWQKIDADLQSDRYLACHRPQSAIAVPLIYRDELLGLVYLEHRQRADIFTSVGGASGSENRQVVLEFIASQAAIAIHNAQLYESLGQRSTAIEASLDGFAIIEGDRFIYLNHSHAAMFGYTTDELLHRSWHCLYSPEQIAEFERTAFPAVGKDRQWRGEAIATRKDGTTFNEEVTLFLTDNQQLICICRDVTARKQAERALEFTQFAVDNAADGLVWMRADGSISYGNKAICQMLGYSPAEFTSLYVWDINRSGLVTSSTWPFHWQQLKQVGKMSVESEHTSRDGRCYPVEISLNYFEFDGEEYNVAQVRDITDRKQAELALRESETRYQKLADNLPGVIYQFRLAADGSIGYPYVNSGSWELFNIAPEAIMNDPQSAIEMIHPDERAEFYRATAESAQNLTPKLWEGRAVLPSGEIKWVKSASRPERQPDGSTIWDGMMFDITDRKRAEIAQSESEARYQKLANNIPGVIYQLRLAGDSNLSFPYISSACERLFNISAAAIIRDANCLLGLMHPDDIAGFRATIAHSIQNPSETVMWEGRAMLADGKIVWMRSTARPELQADGSIVWDGVMLDITAQKAAERERQRQQDALRAIVEWSAMGKTGNDFYRACIEYLATSFDVSYAFLTKQLDRDLTQSELTVLWTGTDFIDPHIMDLAGTPCLETYQNRWGIFPQDLQAQFPQATEIKALGGESYLATTIWDAQGNILGNIGIIDTKPLPADISAMQFILQLFADRISAEMQRHADEEELRRSQQQIKAFIDNSAAAMYLKDLEGRYLLINQTCVNLAGCDAERFLGQTDAAIYPPEVAEPILAADRELIRSGVPMSIEERGIAPCDGIERTYLSQKFVLTDEDGQPYAIGGVSTDITDRKRAEDELNRTNHRLELANQELQRAARLKDEFLATMSHELRTPLNAILGMSEALEDEVFGDLTQRQMNAATTINKSGTHLLSLINDILDVSKMTAGKLELNLSKVSLSELCKSSLVLVKPQATAKQIQLAIEISIPQQGGCANDPSDLLCLDERRMRQVLINLLNNAIKFTADGGRVRLAVSIESVTGFNEPCLCFAISDTGIGICEADLPKLFQPFSQIDGSLNRKYQGTGLGLAIVKQIVELHGGTVTVESEVGQGSCFKVILPHSCLG